MENAIQPLIAQLADGQHLAYDQAVRGFQLIMNGGATPAQMAAFLMGLRTKGETAEEISAGAHAMRMKATKFAAPAGALDTCGTGGDMRGTLNISTAAALLLAACGIPVVKHGNRAVSSKSGSADVLQALGVKIDAEPAVMERTLRELNFCFLLASKYHNAMRHVAPVRQELGIRTVFNLLGPLANPAQPKFQLLGVFSREWVPMLADVLQRLEVARAWVVHGSCGLDEISISGPTYVCELKDSHITSFEITPEDAGLTSAHPDSLKGGNAEYNAQKLREFLQGQKSAYRDAVLLNVAAALIISGKAETLRDGVAMASETLDSGGALRVLHFVIDRTNMPL